MLDQDGVEVGDMEELRAEIARTIEEVRHADPAAASDWTGWRFEVTDASGAILLTINLDPVSLEPLVDLPFGTRLPEKRES